MQENFLNVPTHDGLMNIFLVYPKGKGPFPPVILFMDIWGIREELKGIARRIAKKGYMAILPNFYYREGNVSFEFYTENQRMISLHRLDPKRKAKVNRQRQKLKKPMVKNDIAALLKFVDSQKIAASGAVGSIGWCMGGWFILGMAAAFPDRLQASASLHGTRLISKEKNSPHLLVKRLKGEFYCGWGELDHLSPPEMANKFEELLKPCSVKYNSNLHLGVEHGYALPDRDVYNQQAAEADWEAIFEMFNRQLKN